VVVERPAVGVRDEPACLLDDEGGSGHVVREVRADRALPHFQERGLGLGALVDDPTTDVDVSIELAGGDAGHVERGRAEVEVAPAHARAVDELLQHHAGRQQRTSAQPRGPEQGGQVGVGREPELDRLARRALRVGPAAARRPEPLAALELVHHPEGHVAKARVLTRRDNGDGHAGRLQAGGGRAGAVDRIDDEERAGPAVGHQAAIFRVEADVAFGGQRVLDDPFGNLVDRQRGVATGRACDAFASACGSQLRNDRVPYAGRDLEGQPVRVGHRVTALRSMAAS
jgi:hypothetical protein